MTSTTDSMGRAAGRRSRAWLHQLLATSCPDEVPTLGGKTQEDAHSDTGYGTGRGRTSQLRRKQSQPFARLLERSGSDVPRMRARNAPTIVDDAPARVSQPRQCPASRPYAPRTEVIVRV